MVSSGEHPTASTDWPLVDAILARNRAATEVFCRRYQPFFRRCFETRWHGSPLQALVPDAVQETVFECLRPGGALAGIERERFPGLEPYLRGVVRNVAARVERREARYAAHCQRTGEGIFGYPAPDPDVAERLGRAFLGDAVRKAVAKLDSQPAVPGHTLGELIRMHFREGMAVREIAAAWHEPTTHVHELRRAACRKLRRMLSRVGLVYALRRP